jgi:site-specific DNA-methyltransferase (adenine-specific)
MSLVNCDCLDGFKTIPDGSVDMLLSDWPYGTTGNAWDKPLPLDVIWPEIKRVVKPNGAILLFAQCPFDKVLGASNLKMLRYEWVWVKSNATGFFNANKMPLKKTENILVFYLKLPIYNIQFKSRLEEYKTKIRERHKNYDKRKEKCEIKFKYLNKIVKEINLDCSSDKDDKIYPSNILYFNTVSSGNREEFINNENHPTQKPVSLCAHLIKIYTNPGDLVLDNCAGSGTTLIAAIRTGRRFIGFEKDPKFFEMAKYRVERELNKPRLF